jgi:hypothetical protein
MTPCRLCATQGSARPAGGAQKRPPRGGGSGAAISHANERFVSKF